MDPIIITLSAIALVGLVIVLAPLFRRPNLDDGVRVEAEANDPLLVSDGPDPVKITRQAHYAGQSDPESGLAIAKYENSGNPRVIKYIMARDRSYLTNAGHYVIYEHYRADGSLEYDRTINPEAMLGGGVYVKERLRYYDKDNKPTGEKYFRKDGTLGIETDIASGLFRLLRKDGKTTKFEQFSTPETGTRFSTFRKDGKTVIEETEIKGIGSGGVTRAYFDRDGNPVNVVFTREHIKEGFGMGPKSPPHFYYADLYQRADGTLAYKQNWYARWDKSTEMLADTLGEVVFYDETGTKPVAEYKLVPLPADRPMVVQEVRLYDKDGKMTIADPKSTLPHDLKGIAFQGFRNNIWGTYDDESRDI